MQLWINFFVLNLLQSSVSKNDNSERITAIEEYSEKDTFVVKMTSLVE